MHALSPTLIAGYRPNHSVARRLARDLQSACEDLNGADWAGLIGSALSAAAQTTASVRWHSVRNLGRRIVRASEHIGSVGPRQAALDAWKSVRDAAEAAPDRARAAFAWLRSLPKGRQVDELTQVLLTWMVFYAAAGEADLEGGLPDLDLALGIGAHRSVVSHSLLLGIESELALRFGLSLLDGLIAHMPDDRHPVWSRIAAALDRYGERAMTGVWLGIGAHLIKDAGLLHLGTTKPVVGLPWSMPMAAHQTFLAANGVACAAVASPGSSSPCRSV